MANLNTRARAENTYDAIVVGSGISGGWAAKELTEKGLKTLVLERGPMVRHIEDYPTAQTNPWETAYPKGKLPQAELDAHYKVQQRTGYAVTEYSKHFFVRDDENPYTEDKRFDWIRGHHLGGRSLTWGRQTYRHCPIDFEANAREGVAVDWPIRYADLAPWYDRVERFIGVSGQAEGLAQLPDGQFQPPMEMNCVEKVFKASVEERLGRRITIGRAAHLTAPTEEQIALGRGKCQHRNLCVRGCPFGAYFSSNSATLVAAERTGNLKIRTGSIVTSLILDPKSKRADGVRVLDEASGQEIEFYAGVVFLCASALSTAWIMLNSTSSRFPNGFGNDSDQVGRNIMDHHLGVGAVAEVPGYLDSYYSGRRPNGIYVPRFRNLGDKASARSDFLRGYGYQGGAGRQGWDRPVSGVGAERKAALSQPGPWMFRLGGFGEILPYADNRVTLNKAKTDKYGLPTLTFDVSIRENEKAMRKDMASAAAEMLEAAGFKKILAGDQGYAPGLGIHEMGTARMGRDPKTSVLNAHNQVHACKNVYVTDGAAMTSASCVNPSLTYMALTARACAHAVEAKKRGEI
ncbi:MAG: GMC family oxidoreductase [Phenylobacterium sp. RIFCSPHIGHO2_01_FULL_69_31]|jgi:choline dehydrogenase-like flavoprotein|uniref:GMC oxidoreductase n=1 Tax=Phenylobacterium sp. RIFCSPHIGHO2_01_FULL_69_31 TaxID=1801944 RepID=UPI0008C48CE6|nr:GMC family oxidoreductase [Phenylobacterium sp. RIFCSPHIGHO2_01_FULL_69_31]OHB26127.1 MAG: GMC family oxidoreductase [Phenylobacterium sp. RIFCSPHIGHO2_01_FULL_69_31]